MESVSSTEKNPTEPQPAVVIQRRRKKLGERWVRNHWQGDYEYLFYNYPQFEPISWRKEVRLIQRAQAGDVEAFRSVWEQNVRLAYSTINRMNLPYQLLEDALQEGILGLHRAIQKYQADRLNSFSTYAWHWVGQHVMRFLDNNRFSVRMPVHLKKDYFRYLNEVDHQRRTSAKYHHVAGLERVFEPESLTDVSPLNHPEYYDTFEQERPDRELLLSEIERHLNRREFYIIKHRYGLAGFKPRTLEQVGKNLKITRERVRQIERRALANLKKRLSPEFELFVNPGIEIEKKHQQEAIHSTQTVPILSPASSPLSAVAEITKSQVSPIPENILPSLTAEQWLEIEDRVLSLFKHWAFTFRQANALIHYYGLLGSVRLPLVEVAAALELTPRKTLLALRKGRLKLLHVLKPYQADELVAIRQQLEFDMDFEDQYRQLPERAPHDDSVRETAEAP
ncbi:MAG: hypothetical protein CMJ46_01810 [Planctomyces sp.]|nr:hypothetical protein [Planctomyces sp.]